MGIFFRGLLADGAAGFKQLIVNLACFGVSAA